MGKEEIFKLAERLFNRYEGNILVEDEKVSITARNDFEEKHNIECQCEVKLINSEEWPYSVNVWEHTYCIKGGRGIPCKSEKEVEKGLIDCLHDFNFREKRQLSLFDL